MSVITDGGGGGSTSNICAISPSDMAGNIDNILTRLENVENILSQILGYDITANRLSDITDVLGWINNVTYMGTTGWTLTPAGTLIPPPGWTFLGSGLTLSDGNTYNGVFYDSDGVLQFGFETDGTISGAKPEEWDAAAAGVAQDYAHVSWLLGGGGTIYNGTRGITSSPSISGIDIEIIFTVSQAGVYWVMGGHEFQKKTGQTSTSDSVSIVVNGVIKYFKGATAEGASANATRADVTAGGVLVLSAGDVIRYDNNPNALTQNSVNAVNFSLIRISS